MKRFRRFSWLLPILVLGSRTPAATVQNGAYHVHPGESIQEALNAAATNRQVKTVKVHTGVYRPDKSRLALIWLNAQHDGIRLEAEGDVTLTAANPAISDPKSPSHPAVVNHVLYIGDRVGSNTIVRGFKMTGANHFVTRDRPRQIEPNINRLSLTSFFFTDGGGIKIFGRSYPTLEALEIFDNFTRPCGAGVSIEHPRGEASPTNRVYIRDCIFRNNRTQITGAALDLIWGSSALVRNCLFVGNVSNLGEDYISLRDNNIPFSNNGALTVFPGSRVIVENCTFTANRNGVDDLGQGSVYRDSIFWDNTLPQGLPGLRYELDLADGTGVSGCRIHGVVPDAKGTISNEKNIFSGVPPRFRGDYAPAAPEFEGIGYRPAR